MKSIWNLLRSLDWRVLFAVPALSVLLGVANNLRLPEGRQVRWSGERPTVVIEAEADANRGAWTTDFATATNKATAAHLPVVVVVLMKGCPACTRFHQEIQAEDVKAWQQKLGWYFVMAASDENHDALTYVMNTPVRNTKAPYVGVYWTRTDGTHVMRNFSGLPGQMGVPAEQSLKQEWMHAVEATALGAPGVSFVPEREVGVQIAVETELVHRGRGKVGMSPPVHAIRKGEKVVLTAKPNAGSVFEGWRYPDGRIVQGGPQLTLDDQCQPGIYRAIFSRSKHEGKHRAKRIIRIKKEE